jgi:hypothetical protein
MNKYKSVAIMIHTIDVGLSKVSNVKYEEIDIQLANQMSKREFLELTLKTAESFWNQMTAGSLKNYNSWRSK